MNGPEIMDIYRERLAEQLAVERIESSPKPTIGMSAWLAMSLLQKAIRRGQPDHALRAAATLLATSPSRLWRRLLVTAYEDLGVAAPDLVAMVTAACQSKAWRAHVGGEWMVARSLVVQMATSPKCRAADDLAYVSELHDRYEPSRLELTFEPIQRLLSEALHSSDLPRRALALWFAIGTDRCRSEILRERRGLPAAVFDHLCSAGYPDSIVEVGREGLRKTNEIMCALWVLLWNEAQGRCSYVMADELLPEELIQNAPCWAYDMHVREGNQAIAAFVQGDSATARWAQRHAPPGKRPKLIGRMLFRIESGLVDRRLRWECGDELRNIADQELLGMDPTDALAGLTLLRNDLPVLNQERRRAAASN